MYRACHILLFCSITPSSSSFVFLCCHSGLLPEVHSHATVLPQQKQHSDRSVPPQPRGEEQLPVGELLQPSVAEGPRVPGLPRHPQQTQIPDILRGEIPQPGLNTRSSQSIGSISQFWLVEMKEVSQVGCYCYHKRTALALLTEKFSWKHKSGALTSNTGAPQGSVLHHLLFLSRQTTSYLLTFSHDATLVSVSRFTFRSWPDRICLPTNYLWTC